MAGNMNAHTFNVQLASEVGLNQAILLQHLFYWHQINKKKNHNIIDDRVWTYNTAEGFHEIFPYLTPKQISYAFSKLEQKGFITIGNHNKAGFDQTKWYSLNEKALELFVKSNLQNVKSSGHNVDSNGQSVDSNGQSVDAIPDNNPDSNTDNKPNNIKYNKIYDMLIDGYPKNRIQSKNPVIKLLKTLDKEDIKLILKNKDRYLKSSNGYVKNLRKYIEEECWSEAWLKAEEETKQVNKHITNTKTFIQDYDNIS
jgi:hypothetical protein